MTNYILAVSVATLDWFLTATILFFNPIVDKIYGKEEGHSSVKVLPKSGQTIGKILLAIIVQCISWAVVFFWVKDALPQNKVIAGLLFGGIITLMKIIPRDIDRLLLTTYPPIRMTIEFIIGIVCAMVVAFIYVWMI